jgi:hypothetical protein
LRPFAAIPAAILLGTFVAGCNSTRIRGTYVDATGTIVLELKQGGAARLTKQTQTEECSYSIEADTIPVSCPAVEHTFAIARDGSLSTPGIPGAFRKMA